MTLDMRYFLQFSVYTRQDVQEECTDVGLAEIIVKHVLGGQENRGHVVYIDSFYSSVNLLLELKNRDFGACGTVHSNHKRLPHEMKYMTKKCDLPYVWIEEEYKMLVCLWQDTVTVSMLSTVSDADVTEVDVKSKRRSKKGTETQCSVIIQ